MRIKKLMNDSFYVNSEDFADVNSVDSLSSDLYFHYTKDSGQWKLSGNTTARASGIILEDSTTTSITVRLDGLTGLTAATGSTSYTLTVVNQDDVDVKQECIDATGIVTSNSGVAYLTATYYNVRVAGVGTANVTVTHPDIPSSPVIVPVRGYYPTTVVVVTPAAFTGTTTGQTQQLTVVNQNGYDLTDQCTFESYDTDVFTVNSTGLVTCVGNIGDGYITATHIYSGVYARPTTIWRFQP